MLPPTQSVLLLHAPRQEQTLTPGYPIHNPLLGEVLVQIDFIGLNPVSVMIDQFLPQKMSIDIFLALFWQRLEECRLRICPTNTPCDQRQRFFGYNC